ncbi:Crp/Fnr family transcriptional regulator [Olivibacter sitiensis]|uniref:Crp/Fnr family transcriptional regulator n=1 Tax=Olivibacter sitiensis TaxID=376470 RepID=UPI0004221734|nr:Crp/Fnr family transcriptional regulator [Olivibacter sitiensis]
MSEEDFEVIQRHFIQKRIRKKQYLLAEGEICKYFAFIVKGAMRKYCIDEKGVEHTVDLYIENWWAGDRESFVMSTPSAYNIDAWEDCEVLLISREDTLKLCQQCPAFNELLLKLDERNNIATQKRITSSISFTAEKRYQRFVQDHPYFVQRFPQHIIASYLGITKDTLSRVRKKALSK